MDFPPFLKPKPRKEVTEEELLKEIESEVGPVPKPAEGVGIPPPPVVQRQVSRIPMPSGQQPQGDYETKMLAKEDVSRLPLFMKVEEYDRILSEVNKIAESLKKMDEILATLTNLEQQESEQTNMWRGQLEITKTQIKQLLARMPETGKLKDLVETKKRQQQKEKIAREFTGLERGLKKIAPQPMPEISGLQTDLGILKLEMQSLRNEIRTIAEIAKQRQQAQPPEKKPESSFPRSEYKKVDTTKPW